MVTGLPLTPEDTRPLEEAALPYVLTNRHFGDRPAKLRHVRLGGGHEDALRRLYALGHRRLALLLPHLQSTTVLGHEQGWLAGAAHGLAPHEAPVLRPRPSGGTRRTGGR